MAVFRELMPQSGMRCIRRALPQKALVVSAFLEGFACSLDSALNRPCHEWKPSTDMRRDDNEGFLEGGVPSLFSLASSALQMSQVSNHHIYAADRRVCALYCVEVQVYRPCSYVSLRGSARRSDYSRMLRNHDVG